MTELYMNVNKSGSRSKVIHNPELLERDDIGILIFCDDCHSANSLARHLDENLLKKDFILARHRIDDQVQDPGTVIEIITNIKEIIFITGDILEGINNIIDQSLLLSVKIGEIGAVALTIDKLLKKYPTLQMPVKVLLSIFEWSKKNDAVVTIESNNIAVEIEPQKIKCPESFLSAVIRQLFVKEEKNR